MHSSVTPTAIPEVLSLVPKGFGDSRGFFFENFCQLLGKLDRVVSGADFEDKAWAEVEVYA